MSKCFACQSTMFTGWVENPMYRDNGSDNDEEIMVEMNIFYCPKCNVLSHSDVRVDK